MQANRESALTCALRVGNKQAVNLLLGKGVVLNGRAECGAILQQIVKNYSAEFAQQFFARPDWEVDSHSLANAMELSLTLGDHEMAGFLLRKGANPNRLDKDNMTPLLRLTERGDLGAVETLLKYAQNLDLSATDEQGNTALRIAQYNFHHPEMANLISAYIPKMAAVELTKDITPVQDILHAKDTPDKLAGLQADQAVLKVASLLSSSGMAANADIDESSQVLSPPVTSPQISTQLAKEAAAITKGSAKRKDSGIVESDDYVAPPSGSPGTSPLRRGRS